MKYLEVKVFNKNEDDEMIYRIKKMVRENPYSIKQILKTVEAFLNLSQQLGFDSKEFLTAILNMTNKNKIDVKSFMFELQKKSMRSFFPNKYCESCRHYQSDILVCIFAGSNIEMTGDGQCSKFNLKIK